MERGRQLRHLLWRDYLIRKRKFITLAGIVWATGIMLGIYSVRLNINNQDFPTCQFPARALPSAGVLPFLQSFLCSVSNECAPMDRFEEIPAYRNSKLTQMQGKFAPLLNETVLELAGSMPAAVKLLATVASVADEPTFLAFSKNGLKFTDLFNTPSRVKRYVTSHLRLDDDVAQSLMTSDISFQGLLNGDLDRCSPASLSQTLVVKNKEHLDVISRMLCDLSKEDLQKMAMDLIYEINFSKYIKMLGGMYARLTGDARLTALSELVPAVLRMSRLDHFLPPEAVGLFYGKRPDFSYLHLDLIKKFVGLFEPTFGDTKEYQSIKELADTAVVGLQYLNKIFGSTNDTQDTEINKPREVDISLDRINNVFDKALDAVNAQPETIDPFNVLTKIANLVYKFLPDNYKHDVLLYSTLLAKLMESTQRVIEINMHIEEITYNVTLRNPDAIALLKKLPPAIVTNTFEALVSAERTQILTSKLSSPGDMFCDVGKLQNFLLISKNEAESVKTLLCSDAWKNYVKGLVEAFGATRVKDNINEMAYLFIQETLGKDISSQLYSIDRSFLVLRNFTGSLTSMDSEKPAHVEWNALLGDQLTAVFAEKAHLGKLMLISVHGALAKEVIKQNTILQFKVAPILINTDTFVTALNKQLQATPGNVPEGLKKMYSEIVKTVALTGQDEEMTYKALSTYSEEIVCNGGEVAASYLRFPSDIDTERLAEVLCHAARTIEQGLRSESLISQAIAEINNTTHTILEEVNWTKLINNLQTLYLKLDKDYPYLFEYSTYAMDKVTQQNVKEMFTKAKDYWFEIRNLQRGLQLSVNLGFRLLDLLDHGIFNMTSVPWLKMKFIISNAVGPIAVIDDSIKLITALLTNSSHSSALPPITVTALSVFIPNLPQLVVDAVNIIVSDDTDIEPIIAVLNASPAWPCAATSLADLLELTAPSKDAVRSLETLLCMERNLQEEWVDYLHIKKAKIDKSLTWNTTQYSLHLFLEMSSVFNSVINDTGLVKQTLQYVLNDNSTDGRAGLMTAYKYAVDALNGTEGNEMIRKFLAKFDTVLNAIDTSAIDTSVSINTLWERYNKCVNGSYTDPCRTENRAVFKNGLRILSVVLENFAIDLNTYFTEANEPNSNLLQMFGFTKSTTLYMLYDRLHEFLGVLLDSYWDYGFMSQIRRASQTQFWDCEAVVSALVPAPDSPVSLADIKRVQPYVCPSFIYWISMPRDDNVLFNFVAKPQYYFYSFPVKNSTSRFKSSFSKAIAIKDYLNDIAKDKIKAIKDEVKLDTVKDTLTKFMDKMLNYRIKETDKAYKKFSEINKKLFLSTVYLTRIVAIVNKLSTALTNLTVDDKFTVNENVPQEDVESINADLSVIRNIFKRRAVDVIALHYDVLTDMLWANDNNYTLVDAIDAMCNDLKENNNKTLLVDETRTKMQICAKNYKVLYGAVKDTVMDDYENARKSLLNWVKVLQNGEENNITDVFEFLNRRIQLINSLKRSIKYSYDLGIPIYLKYLQSNVQGYRVVLTFLSGGDWWQGLRQLYNGPESTKFFGFMEQSLDVADNLLNNLDGVHLVRLTRDVKATESESLCAGNLTLSDYLPDATGTVSGLQRQICSSDSVALARELPPMLFTSQGYEPSLKLSKYVDYAELNNDISAVESNLGLVDAGPKEPRRPTWVTDEKLGLFRTNVLNLLSTETLTKISFGVLSNIVDAGTLFLNNSQCAQCSQMTSWFKQLNLQLFKKQEYDNLLCHLHTMSLDDIYYTLKNDFHWDMFIRELISSRNYTNLELNKSMIEFLNLVEVHLLDDLRAPTTKLTECLARNVSRNEFGNATLFLQVLAHTVKLLQAKTPHLHKVAGIKDLPYLKQLHKDVAHNLDVYKPLKEYLKRDIDLKKVVNDDEVVLDLMNADLNLRVAINKSANIDDLLQLHSKSWEKLCSDFDCGDIFEMVVNNLNNTKVEHDLASLQSAGFWQFKFISSILRHTEGILSHTARLAAVASHMDVGGVVGGRLTAMLDTGAKLLMDHNVDAILYSMQGLLSEMRPLLKGSALEGDLTALASGLEIMHQFKTYIMKESDLKLRVGWYFPVESASRVETALRALGINHTNFWSLAAPRVHAGHLLLKPVLSSNDPDFRIATFACEVDAMSQVLSPSDLGVVSDEEVSAATVEQFCSLSEDTAKETVLVLARNADYTPLIDQVKEVLLSKLYSASSLTAEEGSSVVEQLPRLTALLPTLQQSLGEVMDDLASEPLFRTLKDFSSLGSLVSSPTFMADVGNMMCGAPFKTDMSRVINNVIKSKDQAAAVTNQAQLDVLPTEFCRSMYLEIVSMDGGKIVWSFIKPLLMGKILYTPRTPAVYNIIHKANGTFASMIRLTSLVQSFAAAFPALDGVASHRAGLAALQSLLSSPAMQPLRAQLLGEADFDVDVHEMFQKLGDLKSIGQLLSKVSDLLRCINLDRFVAAEDEASLMREAASLSQLNEFSAGIVFLNEDKLEKDLTNVEYKIRMDIENAPTTAREKTFLYTPGPDSSFIENMRYFRGFIQIQDMVDKAIIQLAAEHSRTKQDAEHSRREREVAEDFEDEQLEWAVYTQQEPYPCYRKDFFQTSLYESQALLVGFFFALLFTVTSAVRFLVLDKESGNTMLMSVMGVNLTYHTLSWFLTSVAEMAVTQACVTAVLKWGGILPKTDPTLVFAMLMLFSVSVLSFCYLMSKLFSSASFAAVCVGIAYLATFLPFIVILSLETLIFRQIKMIVCLSMSSALCYAFIFVTRAEAMGHGVTWAHVWDAPVAEDMSIAGSMGMVLFDALLYAAIGWALDRYYGIRSVGNHIITSTSQSDKAGVSIVNVSKTYAAGTRRAKLALDNVSVELHKGQITTLLGHNGAGKTTLTNILTGMVRPSSGHVVVRGGRGRVGACPQHDVLVECLTAREHVALYAQLCTSLPRDQIRPEVDRMLKVLSLGEFADCPVRRLSGGTRRRVSVALAFVAQPALVSLDEPTAGVDPAARRDIWDMIVKLKQDRTILLTTHHLDEAEILSDQVVIMHKGQVHTTGSPVEIKRSLGSGYKLTVTLPDSDDVTERSKSVVAAVREVVRNAAVGEIGGGVEMTLPFYDADGASNDFLQLCTTLEARQDSLGFLGYTLDCSSLEQVFADICRNAYTPESREYDVNPSPLSAVPSKSGSSSSVRSSSELVSSGGARRGSRRSQLLALLRARYQHLSRNRSLLFMLVALPTLFILVAMAFSKLRPPPDDQLSLSLTQRLYRGSTQYLVSSPSIYSEDIDPGFAEQVMSLLQNSKKNKIWDERDSPECKCLVTHQQCDFSNTSSAKPELMVLPDVDTLNRWIVDTDEVYIEERYGGFTSTLANNKTNLIAWYNNKGYHAMPMFLNTLNNAILRAVVGPDSNITTYSHPLKISEEQLSKDTLLQHVADAGVCALVLVAYSAAAAGGAVPLVRARSTKEKRLQLLAAVSPATYWASALLWDLMIIFVNMVLTASVMMMFGFPVFVERNNLVAICILIMLFGYACGNLIHVLEKLFSSASLANMLLFCGNAFLGLTGITVLLILDIISESDATDNARWYLHKIFLLSPQFALGDGMLEIAKNTIQAQVLYRFGMDTYRDPLISDLIAPHVCYLLVVGSALLLLNLAIEYGHFDSLVARWNYQRIEAPRRLSEPEDVSAERRRVAASRAGDHDRPLTVTTIGNINRGFVHTEGKKNSLQRSVVTARDVVQCVGVGKRYRARGRGMAVRDLTLGIAPGECMALLGENGAGKSTTFSMLAGELRPTRGTIYLDGKERDARGLCRGLISYCPQSDAIDPLLTVAETLQLYCRLRGISEEQDVISRTISAFDLEKYASVRSGALSGGNKRKLCTAIAFMARTPLVLLDEPTSGMDPVSRACVWRGCGAAGAARRGVLLSTHALEDARRAAHRVALMRHGDLIALADLDQCLRRFGGGYIVQCSCADARAAWRGVTGRIAHAQLRVLHAHALHFHVPTVHKVCGKEVVTRVSDILRLMAELQVESLVDEYTLNQSSLEQMFLSFSEKPQLEDAVDIEPLATRRIRHDSEPLDRVTAL